MSKRLVAVWVSNYMGIENQGFNLGGKHTFEFTLIDNTLTIEAKETINYVDLFQNSSAITNVTGIVGVNGTGKSSFLKLLNLIFAKKSLSNPVVLIFEEGPEYVYYGYIGVKMLSFRQVNPREGLNVISITTEIKEYETQRMFNDLDLIFYNSNISSQNDQFIEGAGNLINYSASYQFQKSVNLDTTNIYIQEFEEKVGFVPKPKNMFNLFKTFEKERFRRQVKFQEWNNKQSKEPKNEKFKSYLDEVKYPKQISLWFDSQKLFDRWYEEKQDKPDELVDLFLDCENNVLESNFSDNEKLEKLLKFHIEITICMYDKRDLELYLKSRNGEVIENFSESTLLFERQDVWLNLVHKLQIESSSKNFERGVFFIKYTEDLWEFLSVLIDVSEHFVAEIKYSWNPRSSGEESLISQFAELYTAITSDSKSDNVIISIDEGEAYFHPEWQRKYISILCSFLEALNDAQESNKKFQIILTSHSPFIVSDIPHYNLIKLQKDENGFTKVMNNQETETLGGNIFKLFQDEFFVDEFISAFAYEKIKDAIFFMDGREQNTFKNNEELIKFIDIIGEPLIRRQLKQKYELWKDENDEDSMELI